MFSLSKFFRSTAARPTARKPRLGLEGLEDRRLCSIDFNPQAIHFFLTASLQHQTADPGSPIQADQVVVSGSDQDDTIQVTAFNAAAGTMTLRLQQRSGGVLLSDQTVSFQSSKLYNFHEIAIFGNRGNDTILNNTSARMYVDGGEGNDDITGGSRNDLLGGGPGIDTIRGKGGEDYIEGGDGPDFLHGGNGNDSLIGSQGNDLLFGEAGNDLVDGGDGNDNMFGDTPGEATGGADKLLGGNGNDSMDGAGGADSLFGGAGNDIMIGGSGNDFMQGDDGNDLMFGGFGSDQMYGNLGSDSLHGMSGADYLDGGTDDPDLSGDLLEGGHGADTFVKHHHIAGLDDADVFTDFDAAHGDRVDDQWHF